jgi:hypothetical protein
VEKDKIFSCASIEVLEIPTFPVRLMFMYCDNITKFVSCWVQHVIACVATMVVQVHGFVNEKYELLIVNDTNQNFVERVFFFLQASNRLVFYKCTCYSFFEEHLFNHIWWSEVDFDIKFHHNNSCSKQIISSTSWTSQGIDH